MAECSDMYSVVLIFELRQLVLICITLRLARNAVRSHVLGKDTHRPPQHVTTMSNQLMMKLKGAMLN